METHPDNVKGALLRNDKIEDTLHVIAVVSNPCNFKRRYKLTNEFISRMEKEPDVTLHVVELVYDDQAFAITSADNPNHLQLRGGTPLWHKENMINIGVRRLLPANWKAVAWIDTEVEFESAHWAADTLKLLNAGGKDFVQLFTHCVDMTFDEQIMSIFTGFAYQFCKGFKKGSGVNYWHPGYAWACNRSAYEQMGGIFQAGVLGTGHHIMCHAFTKKAPEMLKTGMDPGYIECVKEYQDKLEGLQLGYVPGTIRHYFHGKKINRKYYEREDHLIKHKFNPRTFITENEDGLLVPTDACPKEFIDDIQQYLKDRNEDETATDETLNKPDKDTLEYKIKFVMNEFEKLKKKSKCDKEPGKEKEKEEKEKEKDKVQDKEQDKDPDKEQDKEQVQVQDKEPDKGKDKEHEKEKEKEQDKEQQEKQPQMPQQMPQQMLQQMQPQMLQQMPQQMPQQMLQQMPQQMLQQMPQQMLQQMQPQMPQQMHQQMHQQMQPQMQPQMLQQHPQMQPQMQPQMLQQQRQMQAQQMQHPHPQQRQMQAQQMQHPHPQQRQMQAQQMQAQQMQAQGQQRQMQAQQMQAQQMQAQQMQAQQMQAQQQQLQQRHLQAQQMQQQQLQQPHPQQQQLQPQQLQQPHPQQQHPQHLQQRHLQAQQMQQPHLQQRYPPR